MNWKKEVEFQKAQMLAMLPNRNDLFLMGVSMVGAGIIIGAYSLIWWICSSI